MPNKSSTPSIGARIARYRKEAGFKDAAALADAIPDGRVTKGAIVNLEAGRKADPSVGELLAIAAALRVSPTALIVDIEQPFALADHPAFPPETSNVTATSWLALELPLEPLLNGEGSYAFERSKVIQRYARSLFKLSSELDLLRERLGETTNPEIALKRRESIAANVALIDATVIALRDIGVEVPDAAISVLRDA